MQSTLKSRFEPELSLFIQLTLYRLSVWATGASYGAKLQDLKYTYTVSSAGDGRVLCAWATFCFLFMTFYRIRIDCVRPSRSVYVAPENSFRTRSPDDGLALHTHPFTEARAVQSLARRPKLGSPEKGLGAYDQIGDHPRCGRPCELCCVSLGWTVSHSMSALRDCEPCQTFFSVLFCRYRTTVDRLLGMKLVPSRRLVRRNVSYDFMNRQMVWHAFTVCPHTQVNRPRRADCRDRNSSCSSFPSFLTANSDVSPGWRWAL